MKFNFLRNEFSRYMQNLTMVFGKWKHEITQMQYSYDATWKLSSLFDIVIFALNNCSLCGWVQGYYLESWVINIHGVLIASKKWVHWESILILSSFIFLLNLWGHKFLKPLRTYYCTCSRIFLKRHKKELFPLF